MSCRKRQHERFAVNGCFEIRQCWQENRCEEDCFDRGGCDCGCGGRNFRDDCSCRDRVRCNRGCDCCCD